MAIAHRLSLALLLISLLAAPRPAPAARHTAVLQPALREAVHRPARQRVEQRVDLLPDVQATTASTATLTMTVYLPVIHPPVPWPITRVSVDSDGTEANDSSSSAALSADGQVVAFHSYASNLVEADTNNTSDVFVHDWASGQTTRVSVASDGTESNGWSFLPALSADGQLIVFESDASNLVEADTNSAYDIFVHDRASGQTTRVSVASDGREGNNHSSNPVLSADGLLVAFQSYASNLVEADTKQCPGRLFLRYNCADIFVHDRVTGQTTRVSVAFDDTEYYWGQNSIDPALSADGRVVAFLSDGIFVHDRVTGQTTRVSVASDGTEANGWSDQPTLSADGQVVAYRSYATNLVPGDTNQCSGLRDSRCADIFVHDRVTGKTTRLIVTTDGMLNDALLHHFALSADGQLVAFESAVSTLVAGDTNGEEDVFVHDRASGHTTRVSIASDNSQSNNRSFMPALSADGRVVAFTSWAGNLVAGDTNQCDSDINSCADIFVVTLPAAQAAR